MNLIIVIHKMSSDTPISWNDPSNTDNPQADYSYIPNDTTKEETFFYHSDHLGSTSYITDDHTNVGHYDLSAFILIYSQGILLVVLLVVAV